MDEKNIQSSSLRILGLGFKSVEWERWIKQLKQHIRSYPIEIDHELLTAGITNFSNLAKSPLLSWKPHAIFTSIRFFKNPANFHSFFESCSKLSGYRLGSIFLLQENIERSLQSLLDLKTQLHFPNEGKITLPESSYMSLSGFSLPYRIHITPSPLFEWKTGIEKRNDWVLSKNLQSISWKNKDFEVDDFFDLICKEYRIFHFRNSILGFERINTKTFLFTGIPLPEIYEFIYPHFSIAHLIQEDDFSSYNFYCFLKKFTDIAKAEVLKYQIQKISKIQTTYRSNTPVQIIAKPRLIAQMFANILEQNKFKLLQSNSNQAPFKNSPQGLMLDFSKKRANEKSFYINFSDLFIKKVMNPEIKENINRFSFQTTSLKNLPTYSENKNEQFILHRKLEKIKRRKQTLISQTKLYEYELNLLQKAESKLEILEILLNKSKCVPLENLPRIQSNAILYLSYDPTIAASISQYYSNIPKRVWLNLKEIKTWQQIAALHENRYVEFVENGVVLILKEENEQLQKSIQKCKESMKPLKQHNLHLNEEQTGLEEEFQELEKIYLNNLYTELTLYLQQIFCEKEQTIQQKLEETSDFLNKIKLSENYIQNIYILTSLKYNQEIFKNSFLELFPHLHHDQIKTHYQEIKIIKQLDYEKEEALRIQFPEKQLYDKELEKILAKMNATQIHQYLTESQTSIEQNPSSLLVLEQDGDLILHLVQKLRNSNQFNQCPIIAFVSGEMNEEKLQQLIQWNVNTYYRGWNPMINPAEILHLLQPLIAQQVTR